MNKKALLVLPLIVSLLSGCPGKNNNNANKHVTIGMDKKEVMKLLGDPNFTIKDEGKWYYFDSDFTKKYDEMNKYLQSDNEADIIRARDIYEELEQMHFTYKFVHFSMDDKAIEYFYDTNHHYDENHDYLSWDSKTETSLELENFSGVDCYKSGETFVTKSETPYKYEVKYSDSSIYRGIITPIDMTILEDENDGYLGKWRVNDYREFTSKININAYDGYVNVQYDHRIGTISGIGLYNQGDIVTLTSSLVEGYTTDGWYDAYAEKITDSLVYTFTFEGTGYQNYIYLATPIRYTITYNLDGGTNSIHNPIGYTIQTSCDLYAPTREGYSFLGWYDKNGNKVESIEAGRTGDLELTARWEDIIYKVTYLDENNNVLFEGTSTYEEGVLPYPNEEPTKEATDEYIYEFKEWKLLSNENYHYTYQAEFKQISKADKLEEMISDMSAKLLKRIKNYRYSNYDRTFKELWPQYFSIYPKKDNFYRYYTVAMDCGVVSTTDGENFENGYVGLDLMIDQETFEAIDYLNYVERTQANEHIQDNYAFEYIYDFYNHVFKGKEPIIYEEDYNGYSHDFLLNCPEDDDEVENWIYKIETKCYNLASWYNRQELDFSVYYGDKYGWEHPMFITGVKMYREFGSLWYLEVDGLMRHQPITNDEDPETFVSNVRILLNVESEWRNRVSDAIDDITFNSSTHISEDCSPEVLMHIYNAIDHDATEGARYYKDGAQYTPGYTE